jgi:hypothetical protein
MYYARRASKVVQMSDTFIISQPVPDAHLMWAFLPERIPVIEHLIEVMITWDVRPKVPRKASLS